MVVVCSAQVLRACSHWDLQWVTVVPKLSMTILVISGKFPPVIKFPENLQSYWWLIRYDCGITVNRQLSLMTPCDIISGNISSIYPVLLAEADIFYISNFIQLKEKNTWGLSVAPRYMDMCSRRRTTDADAAVICLSGAGTWTCAAPMIWPCRVLSAPLYKGQFKK